MRPDTYILIWLFGTTVICWIVDEITRAVKRNRQRKADIKRLHKRCTYLERQLDAADTHSQMEIHIRNEVINELDDRIRAKDFLLRQKWRER